MNQNITPSRALVNSRLRAADPAARARARSRACALRKSMQYIPAGTDLLTRLNQYFARYVGSIQADNSSISYGNWTKGMSPSILWQSNIAVKMLSKEYGISFNWRVYFHFRNNAWYVFVKQIFLYHPHGGESQVYTDHSHELEIKDPIFIEILNAAHAGLEATPQNCLDAPGFEYLKRKCLSLIACAVEMCTSREEMIHRYCYYKVH